MNNINEQKIDQLFERTIRSKQIHEAVLLVENTAGDVSYSKEYGGKHLDTPFLMASITKLFTTACVFILKEQGRLSLDDALSTYLPEETLYHLHTYKGREYSMDLTLSHLLFQTSGLPDLFEEGSKAAKERAIREDTLLEFDEIRNETAKLTPHFAPGTGKRAHYADINFDLLGKVIEAIVNSPLEDVFAQLIVDRLNLEHTYLPASEDDFVPDVYYKGVAYHRPKAVRSSRASGGSVSTARELMIFLKAFFKGELFPQRVFQELDVTNKLQASMYPIRYGAGYMRIPMGGLPTLFMGRGELAGHSGSTGSFAFYYPAKDLFFVGDVNQMANPALPIRLAMRLAFAVK